MHQIATAAAEWAVNNGHAHCSEAHRQFVFGVYYDLLISSLAAYEAELVRVRSSIPEPSLN